MMKLHKLTFDGLRICELGCTELRNPLRRKSRTRVARTHFARLGATSVSIDINGKFGSLPLDLGEPLDIESLGGQFDLVLNAGTAEHVKNQETLFSNVYNLCRPGGIVVHIGPKEGVPHGLYQYSPSFFAKDKRWRLSDTREAKNTLYCTLQKL